MVLTPAVERRQRIELALDRPVGADGRFLAPQQPDPQHLLQVGGPGEPVGQAQPLFDQLVPDRGAVVRIHEPRAYICGMDAFTELCVELLSPLGPVRVRRMFGGQGLYVDDLFMALIDDSQLFLKADEVTRERFAAAGCLPFSYPTKDGERQVMSYYRPPEEALESPPLMLPWARLALEAALRAANAKKAKPAARSATAKPAAARRRTGGG
mmetsp:Transcript_53684/g.126297  ORF Transcript_53684/g.126297 Transcript_53684/m.126297 type:complete len:211 (-) Transcript_53684:703-1335(-)